MPGVQQPESYVTTIDKKEKLMVNVIGLGYIGLPTALMLASHGVEVVGTNHSQGKVDI